MFVQSRDQPNDPIDGKPARHPALILHAFFKMPVASVELVLMGWKAGGQLCSHATTLDPFVSRLHYAGRRW